MTDQELLELAAKAAGYDYITETEGDVFAWKERSCVEWNPLTDDGDALRLAVRLQMDLVKYDGLLVVHCQQKMVEHEYDNDPYAATRRAIAKAAAEIGKEQA